MRAATLHFIPTMQANYLVSPQHPNYWIESGRCAYHSLTRMFVLLTTQVWPFAHLVNFALIPSSQRILYINIIAILWTAFLSSRASSTTRNIDEKRKWINTSDEVLMVQWLRMFHGVWFRMNHLDNMCNYVNDEVCT
jgi:hypothetical protein